MDHALVVGLLCNLPHKLALEILQKATKKLGFHYKHILVSVNLLLIHVDFVPLLNIININQNINCSDNVLNNV